jgi:hypothetical protein
MLRRLTPVLLLCVVALTACDATLSDPLDPRGDLAALLSVDGAAGQPAGPLTLPGLLHAAVHKVYREQGGTAARALVSDLQRLLEEGRTAAARGEQERAAALGVAAREEQLGIVLRVFGGSVVERVGTGVSLDAARLARAVAESAAADRPMPRAHELLRLIDGLLAQSRLDAEEGRMLPALDAATHAAAHVERVRQSLAEAQRIPALHELFDLAAARLRAESGAESGAESAREALAPYQALRREAATAVSSGDRQRAHEALDAVRAEQIRIVLHVLGDEAVARLLDAVKGAGEEVRAALAQARAGGRDLSRLERMAGTARDLVDRGRAAFSDGDPATALELASHAAGLINSVRLTLTVH